MEPIGTKRICAWDTVPCANLSGQSISRLHRFDMATQAPLLQLKLKRRVSNVVVICNVFSKLFEKEWNKSCPSYLQFMKECISCFKESILFTASLRLFWNNTCLKGQCHEIFDFRFFHESVSPKAMSIPLGPFQNLTKILRDILSSRCPTGVVDTGGKWKKSSNRKVLYIFLDTFG